MIVWVLIFVLVIIGLVYLTINHKKSVSNGTAVDNIMPNDQLTTMQVEGVTITILKDGTGVAAKAGDTVAMNYTGKLLDGTTFDSNVDPKFNHVQPFVFSLGAGQVIKGWDLGVAGMKVGEKRNLLIKPEDGYGATGAGSSIPPNATLSFDVELLGIK